MHNTRDSIASMLRYLRKNAYTVVVLGRGDVFTSILVPDEIPRLANIELRRWDYSKETIKCDNGQDYLSADSFYDDTFSLTSIKRDIDYLDKVYGTLENISMELSFYADEYGGGTYNIKYTREVKCDDTEYYEHVKELYDKVYNYITEKEKMTKAKEHLDKLLEDGTISEETISTILKARGG